MCGRMVAVRKDPHMNKTLDSIVQFYTPFTHPKMDASFQRKEVFIPLILRLLLAIGSMVPLFIGRRWIIGSICIVGMFAVLHTVGSALMYFSSDPIGKGRYVAPSVVSLIEPIGMLLQLVIAFAGFAAAMLFLQR